MLYTHGLEAQFPDPIVNGLVLELCILVSSAQLDILRSKTYTYFATEMGLNHVAGLGLNKRPERRDLIIKLTRRGQLWPNGLRAIIH